MLFLIGFRKHSRFPEPSTSISDRQKLEPGWLGRLECPFCRKWRLKKSILGSKFVSRHQSVYRIFSCEKTTVQMVMVVSLFCVSISRFYALLQGFFV